MFSSDQSVEQLSNKETETDAVDNLQDALDSPRNVSHTEESNKRNDGGQQIAAISSGTTRHYCDLCNYSTLYRHDMESHQKKHSWNQKFKCPRCSYSAKRQGFIDQHLMRDHLNVPTHRDDSLPEQSIAMEPNNG